MSQKIEVVVPDIGDFKDVEVIEVLVRPGERIPVDARVIAGVSDLDTGESEPQPAAPGIVLRAGTMNLTGLVGQACENADTEKRTPRKKTRSLKADIASSF